MVMTHVGFKCFLDMRLVCKRWADVSRLVIRQWYARLDRDLHVRRQPRVYMNHWHPDCTLGTDCRMRWHYESSVREPVVLKTMALCDQVFRAGAQRELQVLQRNVDNYTSRCNMLHKQLQTAQGVLAHFTRELRKSEAATEVLLARLATRKRRKIDISKAL